MLIGDSGVGKSNLLSRFTRNEFNLVCCGSSSSSSSSSSSNSTEEEGGVLVMVLMMMILTGVQVDYWCGVCNQIDQDTGWQGDQGTDLGYR